MQNTPKDISFSEVPLELGRVIRRKREELDLSQEKFSELTGHHRTYIGFLERGERSPNVVTLQRVAHALNLLLGICFLREVFGGAVMGKIGG